MSVKSNKNITGYIKLCIPAQKATPAPPVGPAFGQKGLSGAEFCKQFNERTKNFEVNAPVKVLVTAFADRKFTFEVKGSPASYLIKKAASIEKGSSEPGRNFVGTLSQEAIDNVAAELIKLGSINTNDLEKAAKIVKGIARSMGLKSEKKDTVNG